MTDQRTYPEESASAFPQPPASFTDGEGREIEIRSLEDESEGTRQESLDALADMYERFDPVDRAQGIPPTGRNRIEEWLESLARSDAVNVLAWHDDAVAGHATLVPDGSGAFELAIFVHQDYQRAGIGSTLLGHLLGAGAAHGVERIWLTVERWNDAAISLYRDVGFERTGDDRFELEMALRLE